MCCCPVAVYLFLCVLDMLLDLSEVEQVAW